MNQAISLKLDVEDKKDVISENVGGQCASGKMRKMLKMRTSVGSVV